MADRERSETLRANERVRQLSGVLTNLGTALLGAGAVKGYTDTGAPYETLAWILIGATIIWSGWKLLGLLESED